MDHRIDWLLNSDEPWTRYRTMIDLLDLKDDSDELRSARDEMLNHPSVQFLVKEASTWPGYSLKRHNDAAHPIYKLSTIADFGLHVTDPGVEKALKRVLAHQSPEGAFETPVLIPKSFGGTGEEIWTWILCDSPTLLYSLQVLGLNELPSIQEALSHLTNLVEDNGWRCSASPKLGRFKGPGRRGDPCPIANVYTLKALSFTDDRNGEQAAQIGTEMLSNHWQTRHEKKYFLFGMGTDFSKLKYPFVWYDILHVMDVLSLFPWVHNDPRFKEMLDVITRHEDEDGFYTASSMYRAWKEWSFANKKRPSPWLTFLVLRIQKRTGLSFERPH